ncbi:MAG: hypothetical protein WA982_00520 [Rubrobacteraceae bacterium]
MVNAPPERVWRSLLNNTTGLSGVDQRAIARHEGPQPYVTHSSSEAGELGIKVDEQKQTVTTEGGWWYRGTFSVEPYEAGGSHVIYAVENVATGVGWWIARFIQGLNYTRQMEQDLQETINAIESELDVPDRLLGR